MEVKTSTNQGADMGSNGAIFFGLWNAYNQYCGTPWLQGPNGFQVGNIQQRGDCNGLIMPKKVIFNYNLSFRNCEQENIVFALVQNVIFQFAS